ncbi:MAG: hypothetical protein R2697_17225 [Ilumatobacteraceae bacterium]
MPSWRQLDEQVIRRDDADDTELRALVSETPGAAQEANQARSASALDRHRQHVVDEIAKLERARTSCSTSSRRVEPPNEERAVRQPL